jgi:hypothetical protein
MSAPIKAIETAYRGCYFRSRLEARWAVFFDALEIPWEYEPQGFELPSGNYLPDFWLPSLESWFEVKGENPIYPNGKRARGCKLAFDLAKASGKPVHLAWGSMPDLLDERGKAPDRDILHYGSGDFGYAFCSCPMCGKIGIQHAANGLYVCLEFPDLGWHGIGGEQLVALAQKEILDWRTLTSGADIRIVNAYRAARSARFEHGYSGAVL